MNRKVGYSLDGRVVMQSEQKGGLLNRKVGYSLNRKVGYSLKRKLV